MKSTRFAALFAASILVACSGDDAGTAPEDDTGIGEETSSDTGSSSTDTGSDDTGSDDSTVTDSGSDETSTDSSSTDSGSTDSSSDASGDTTASDSGTSDSGTSDSGSDSSDSGASDSGGDSGKPCSFSGGGCSASEYCDTPTCDKGTCKSRPATTTKEFDPACGCDGVSYWNQSVAAITGHSSNPGKCKLDGSGFATKFCGLKGCDPSEVCIADLTDHGSCGLGGFGKTCWRLVSGGTCPATAKDLPKVRECSGGTPGGCTGFCKAILVEESGGITGFLEDTTCP